jgi:hypothetical protein
MGQAYATVDQVWALQARKLGVGDSVRFRVPVSGNAEGIVLEVLPEGYVRVLWDGSRQVSVVHGPSLVSLDRVSPRGRS